MLLSSITFAAVGTLFVLLGWPMMRRKVPPNGLYGLRVPATHADEWVWYEANALAGRDFVVLGAMVGTLAILLPLVPGLPVRSHSLILVTLLTGGSIWIAASGWTRANRLLRQKQARDRAEV